MNDCENEDDDGDTVDDDDANFSRPLASLFFSIPRLYIGSVFGCSNNYETK